MHHFATNEIYAAIKGDDFVRKYSSPTSLEGRVVLRDDYTNQFCVVEERDFYRIDARLSPDNRHYHEVAIGTMPQRLRFDLDCSMEKLTAIDPAEIFKFGETLCNWSPTPREIVITIVPGSEEHFHLLYRYIRDTVIRSFMNIYGKGAELQEYETIHQDKFSRHIIISNGVVSSSFQADSFTRFVLRSATRSIRETIDPSVCKSVQSFRLPGHKKKGGAAKRRINDRSGAHPESPNPLAMLRPPVGAAVLPDEFDAEPVRVRDPVLINDRVAQLAHNTWKASPYYDSCHVYRGNRHNDIEYNRTESSECSICNKIHDRDHTVVIRVTPDAFYLRCRRERERSIYLGSYSREGDHVRLIESNYSGETSIVSLKIAEACRQLEEGRLGHSSRFTATLVPGEQYQAYSEPTMRPYPNVTVLAIRAAMKMGKTNQLRPLVEKLTASRLVPFRVMFVSFRQTFSREIKSKFPEFTLYNDVQGALNYRNLIVQVESLHRLERCEDTIPTLLILDEIESVLEQFSSGLSKMSDADFQNFQWLVEHSEKIVAMDANFSDRSWNTLLRLRPGMVTQSRCYVHNQFRNAGEDVVYLHSVRAAFLERLIDSLSAGSGAVALMTNSLMQANTLHAYIQRQVPGIRTMIYSSETSRSISAEHFRDVNTHWCDYDCIIFTPTVTAGVSFEMRHFSRVFAVFTNVSCSAATCTQMMGRIRDVAEHEFHILYEHGYTNVPTSEIEIRNYMERGYQATMHDEYDPFEAPNHWYQSRRYARDGQRFDAIGDAFVDLHVENLRVKHQSRMNFMTELVRLLAEPGARVQHVDEDGYMDMTGNDLFDSAGSSVLRDDLADIDTDFKSVTNLVKGEIREQIAGARDISDEEANVLFETMSAAHLGTAAEIKPDDALAIRKYQLRRHYGGFAGTIDAAFVKKYNREIIKSVYRNLCAYYSGATPDEALSRQRARDVMSIRFARMDMRPVRGHTTEYRSKRMTFALALLRQFGFSGIDDPATITGAEVESVFDNGIADAPLMAVEWSISNLSENKLQRLDGYEKIEYGLKFVNSILAHTWGVTIVDAPLIAGAFELKSKQYFAPVGTPPEGSIRPVIIPMFERDPEMTMMGDFGAEPEPESVAAEPKRNAQGMIISDK